MSTATTEALTDHTYVPTDAKALASMVSFLDMHERARGTAVEPRYFLAGAGEGDQIELPKDVHAILVQIIHAMAAGKAVSVRPLTMKLTTQQAADMLGVSRPTVVKLTEDGALPVQRIGTRRMLLLDDVLSYREKRRQQQYAFLAATAVDIDDDTDPAEVEEQLRAVRKAVAARRRG